MAAAGGGDAGRPAEARGADMAGNLAAALTDAGASGLVGGARWRCGRRPYGKPMLSSPEAGTRQEGSSRSPGRLAGEGSSRSAGRAVPGRLVSNSTVACAKVSPFYWIEGAVVVDSW
jgi:hypothetical protein